MNTARRSTVQLPNNRDHLYLAVAQISKPRPLTKVSAWADQYRILSSKGSGEPGPWRTARTQCS